MKRNDIRALHDKTEAELQTQLTQLQQQLVTSRLQLSVGKLADVRVSKLADDIARVKTVLREKQLVAALTAVVKTSEEVKE